MALTVTKNTALGDLFVASQLGSQQPIRLVFGTIDWDAAYVTGGEELIPSDIGLETIQMLAFFPHEGIVAEYDSANDTVIARFQTDPADAGGANILLVEVDNAFNLSAVTGMPFIAIGTV